MKGFYVDPYPGIWYNICTEEYPTGKLVEAIKAWEIIRYGWLPAPFSVISPLWA